MNVTEAVANRSSIRAFLTDPISDDVLRDLLTKADRSDKLEELLEEILSNTKAMSALSGELGIGKDGKDKGGK